MPKPILGYPSRAAAIRAFIDEGDTLEQVADRLGIYAGDVKCYLGYKNGRFFPKRPGRYFVDRDGGLHPCLGKSIAAVAAVTIRPANANDDRIGPVADAACPPREEDPAPAVTAPAPSPAMPPNREGTAGETAPGSEASFDRLPVRQSGRARMAGRAGVNAIPRAPEAPPRLAPPVLPAPAAREAEPSSSFVVDGTPVQRRCSGCGSWQAAPCARRWCPLRPAELLHA